MDRGDKPSNFAGRSSIGNIIDGRVIAGRESKLKLLSTASSSNCVPDMQSAPFPGFKIGEITVDPPVVLAPMEDVTSLPMRVIAKRIANPGLLVTEFISAMAVHYGAEKTLKKMRIDPGERPLSIQIFGAEPEIMAESARLAEEMGADIVDINMGCWVPKVCKTGSGAALLKDPDRAEDIVRAVVNAVKIPVTVKVRAGWDYSLFAAPDLAKRFEQVGIKMLTLHARFAKQGFEGEADWRLIGELRKALSIPLVGNGDVKTPADAIRMLSETGCDGVMVGRAAIANPWALAAITAAVSGRPIPAPPTLSERIEVALEHVSTAIQFEEEEFAKRMKRELSESERKESEGRAVRALRGIVPMYVKGFEGAAQVRSELYQSSSYAEISTTLQKVREIAHLSTEPQPTYSS